MPIADTFFVVILMWRQAVRKNFKPTYTLIIISDGWVTSERISRKSYSDGTLAFTGDILMQFDFSTKQVAMLEGTLLPSNMAAKTTFCLYLVNVW